MGTQQRTRRDKNRKGVILLSFLVIGLFSSCSNKVCYAQSAMISWEQSPFFQDIIPKKTGGTRQKNLVYADAIYAKLLKKQPLIYAVKSEQLKEIPLQHADFHAFSEICAHSSLIHPLVGTVSEDEEDVEITCRLLESIFYNIEDPFLQELFTMETLAKVLAYRSCQVGQRVPITLRESSGKAILVNYVIAQVFDMGNTIPAYGLVPVNREDLPSILLFRGSEFALNKRGRATLSANLDFNGPGHNMYMRARDAIRSWLVQQGKARSVGFSLGGMLAFYSLFYDGEFMEKEERFSSYAFNMPGISKKLLDKLGEIPPFKVYVNQGDPVSKIGNLVGNVFVFSFPFDKKPMKAHNAFVLGESRFFLGEVDVELENRQKRMLH